MRRTFLILVICLYHLNLAAQDTFSEFSYSTHTIKSTSKEKEIGVMKKIDTLSFKNKRTKTIGESYQQIEGYIIDGSTNKTIPFARLRLLTSNRDFIAEFRTDANGFFQSQAPCNLKLHIEATHRQYNIRYRKLQYKNPQKTDFFKMYLNPVEGIFEISDELPFIEPKNVPIKVSSGQNLVDLPQILFSLNKSALPVEESLPILNRLISLLTANPHLALEITSHTDSRGPEEYLLDLSQQRAENIRNYLINSEIDSQRIKAKGYGYSKVKNKCKKDVKCTKSQHLTNRRIEFVILNPIRNY